MYRYKQFVDNNVLKKEYTTKNTNEALSIQRLNFSLPTLEVQSKADLGHLSSAVQRLMETGGSCSSPCLFIATCTWHHHCLGEAQTHKR